MMWDNQSGGNIIYVMKPRPWENPLSTNMKELQSKTWCALTFVLVKLWFDKYDFDLCKGFFMGIIAQIF